MDGSWSRNLIDELLGWQHGWHFAGNYNNVLCCEKFAGDFILQSFWQPIPICTFAKAWNSGDLALRYTYVEFVVVTTWNGKPWKRHMNGKKSHELERGCGNLVSILELSKHM